MFFTHANSILCPCHVLASHHSIPIMQTPFEGHVTDPCPHLRPGNAPTVKIDRTVVGAPLSAIWLLPTPCAAPVPAVGLSPPSPKATAASPFFRLPDL